MIKSKKIINVLIDNIDPEIGVQGNITKADDTFFLMDHIFPEAEVVYHASGELVDCRVLIPNWIYPIVLHNLTFLNFMFDWGDSNRDLLSMLSTRVRHQYFSNRGVIVFFIIEPFQTMDPNNDALNNFIQMIEENPRYNNIIFLNLHYIDSANFIFTNILENTMENWGPLDKDTVSNTYNYLENYKDRRYCSFLINYKESSERLLLLKFLEKNELLDKGFVSANEYECDKIFKSLDIKTTFNKILLNIIPEGNYYREGYNFISEKTYRSFKHKKPFIYLGQYKSLKYIKDIGYKTFSPIIDESYDDIEDNKVRLGRVCTEIKRLMDKPLEEFEKDMKELESICEYNYNKYFADKKLYKDKFYKKIYGTKNASYKQKL